MSTIVDRIRQEPVRVQNAVVAVVAVVFAAVTGDVTQGIVVAAVLAVLSVVTRSAVTPNDSVLVHIDAVDEVDEDLFWDDVV